MTKQNFETILATANYLGITIPKRYRFESWRIYYLRNFSSFSKLDEIDKNYHILRNHIRQYKEMIEEYQSKYHVGMDLSVPTINIDFSQSIDTIHKKIFQEIDMLLAKIRIDKNYLTHLVEVRKRIFE